MVTFINMLKTVLEAEEGNEYGNTALTFLAKFVTSFESEKTHPILADTFAWLLSVGGVYCTFSFCLLLLCLFTSCASFSISLFPIARIFVIASVSR